MSIMINYPKSLFYYNRATPNIQFVLYTQYNVAQLHKYEGNIPIANRFGKTPVSSV